MEVRRSGLWAPVETHKGLNQPLEVSTAVSTFGICRFPTREYSEPRHTLKTIGS